jgi:hypothetical protein
MKRSFAAEAAAFFVMAAMVLMNVLLPAVPIAAADHAEATAVSGDPGADIADAYFFLSPLDNSRVVLAVTVEGFIVPSELLNLGHFSEQVVYRFEIENTGDAVPDRFIDIQFGDETSRSLPQTAFIYLNGIYQGAPSFTGLTTVQTHNAVPNPFVVTTDAASGVKFFAGMTDDPFYFDIPAFNRYTASVTGGNPNPALLQRARDSFAGYNIHTIALEMPVSALRGSAGNVVGLNSVTLRSRLGGRQPATSGKSLLYQVDRMATPAINTAAITYPRKNEYNNATPVNDAQGQFAGTIVGTLQALGTNPTNINILATVAVTNGDYLRLNTAQANPSLGFGERATTPGYVGFPNGRRTGDDTIDVLFYFIFNQTILTGENVNSNDKPLQNTFPFFGTPHQPLENPAVDPTQN